jgi:hypothetical protein
MLFIFHKAMITGHTPLEEEFLRLVWNSNVHIRVQKSLSLISILTQINAVQILPHLVYLWYISLLRLSRYSDGLRADGHCHIASARTAKRTQLPTSLLLLRACLLRPLPSNGICLFRSRCI